MHKDNFRWLFPEQLWDYNVTANTPKAFQTGRTSFVDSTYILRKDTPYLNHITAVEEQTSDKRWNELIAHGQTIPERGRFYKAEELLTQLLIAWGRPTLFSNDFKSRNGNSEFLLLWKIGEHSATLRFVFGAMSIHAHLNLTNRHGNSRMDRSDSSGSLKKAPADIKASYFNWLGKVYKLRALPDD
jgi:hypothetical protein